MKRLSFWSRSLSVAMVVVMVLTALGSEGQETIQGFLFAICFGILAILFHLYSKED